MPPPASAPSPPPATGRDSEDHHLQAGESSALPTGRLAQGPGPTAPRGVPSSPPPPFVSNLTLHTVSGGKVFIILNYYCFEINGRFSSHAALHDLWKDRVELLGRGLRDTWTGHQSPTQVPGARDHRMTSKTRTKLLRQTFFKGKNMCILKAI